MARSRAQLRLVVDNAFRLSQFCDESIWNYRVKQVGDDMPAARLVSDPVNDAATRARRSKGIQRMRHEDALNALHASLIREARSKGLVHRPNQAKRGA